MALDKDNLAKYNYYLITINNLAKSLYEGLQTNVMCLDFSKAFDKVDHTHLIHKLNLYSIQGSLLSWLKDLLLDRYQHVIIEEHQSSIVKVISGYLCFINDLPEEVLIPSLHNPFNLSL